jgi:hypothetical protein
VTRQITIISDCPDGVYEITNNPVPDHPDWFILENWSGGVWCFTVNEDFATVGDYEFNITYTPSNPNYATADFTVTVHVS